KLPVFEQWLRDRQLDRSEVLFMGDDIPDLEIMQNVGLPACPADAAIDVKQIATYTSPMRGGKGCARDVIEQTMRAQGNWLSDKKAFGW
ncbi:MAG: HAD hydrolase family protein, partial [Candidatus Limisoma sp.]|nr:HAD hydrolase family protein [Candidatus Limisoma sp.]